MKIESHDSIVEKLSVICGSCALARAGLITQSPMHLCLMTSYRELDGVDLVWLSYYHYQSIDYEHWVVPSKSNPLLLLPTKERAIVEYIKNERCCDEGILIEALKTYLTWFRDDGLLWKVADFFRLNGSILSYWINEALTDEEV